MTTLNAGSVEASNAVTFPCRNPECAKSFPTKIGRGVHEQRAHRNWHDDKQVESIDRKKAPWSAEESAILARQEARLTLEGVKFMNQALLPLFPNRTLESIKGQRRYQKHKDLVLERLIELKGEGERPAPPVPGGEPPPVRESALATSVCELFERLPPLAGTQFHVGDLGRICDNVKTWSTQKISEELEIYLLKLFPPTSRNKRKPNDIVPERVLTKRKARRVEYARTQKAWRKDPCKILRVILKSKSAEQEPNQLEMTQFWQTVMSEGRHGSPPRETARPTIEELLKPISLSDVKSSFPALNTCPGPDGLSIRQLKAVPLPIIVRIYNLFLLCGKLPGHLLKGKTTLIPKKDGANRPEDYRPITVQSVLTRAYHKILARRLTDMVELDPRQKAFLPTDGGAHNTFCLDMILKYHRQNFKPLYMASTDIAKAFDSLSHTTIRETLEIMGIPSPMVAYIMDTYERGTTTLSCGTWESERFKPACGVKQGDPLSPIIFNMVIDRLLRQLPPKTGVDVGGNHFSALAFADDLIFLAQTPIGLQQTIDVASVFLEQCGLNINASKSFTVSITNVPHMKKSVVDGKSQFTCLSRRLPALRREDEWKYLGIPFSPEGRTTAQPEVQLVAALDKLTKAPLKPQQRLFALRVMVLPGLYHLLTLGNTTLSRLKKIDSLSRAAVRKWLTLPHDTVNAYFHANAKEGGLSIPSMRWLMPLHRLERLNKLATKQQQPNSFLTQEIQKTARRLTVDRILYNTTNLVNKKWADQLHSSNDGHGLKESGKVPQQHLWVTQGNRFLSGKDFIHAIKLRINAMPTRSRTTRGRISDRSCRAGCNVVETLNHVLQQCHRTHRARLQRHDAIVNYIKRGLCKNYDVVQNEPHFNTDQGLRKPDLVAVRGTTALVLDAQVVNEHLDLNTAHKNKVEKYQPLDDAIRERYNVTEVSYSTATLNYRGVWSVSSATELRKLNILKASEFKIISTRVLVGGLNGFWRFNKTTSMRNQDRERMGVG